MAGEKLRVRSLVWKPVSGLSLPFEGFPRLLSALLSEDDGPVVAC